MPLAAHAAPTVTPPASVEPAPTRRRILVVDDQADNADMFGLLLERLGQDVAVAYDGHSAIELARQFQPQIAFLDVTMPGMSGLETARRLRQTLSSASVTLVAVTGHDKTHGAVQGGEFDHHLLKPVTREAVVALLNALPLESRP
jgi:CheY-like chemotaxis protein